MPAPKETLLFSPARQPEIVLNSAKAGKQGRLLTPESQAVFFTGLPGLQPIHRSIFPDCFRENTSG